MNKFILATLLVLIGYSKFSSQCAQQFGFSTVDPVDQAIQSSAYIIPVLQAKILKANLPADLQEQADQVVANTQEQLKACEDAAKETGIIFVYKMCANTAFKVALNQIDALEAQAKAQADATSTVAGSVVAA